MNANAKIIVVAGATGLQGTPTSKRLLRDGFRVRALTRDPASEKAKALAAQGIEPAKGNFEDRASLVAALEGAHGAFVMATPFGKGGDVSVEERHAKNMVDAAIDAKVAHVVYSSVGGAERNSGVPHFESKWRVEQHIAARKVPATILRPAVFMDMFATSTKRVRALFHAMLSAELGKEKPLQLVACEDIAAFTSIAFQRPGERITPIAPSEVQNASVRT